MFPKEAQQPPIIGNVHVPPFRSPNFQWIHWIDAVVNVIIVVVVVMVIGDERESHGAAMCVCV